MPLSATCDTAYLDDTRSGTEAAFAARRCKPASKMLKFRILLGARCKASRFAHFVISSHIAERLNIGHNQNCTVFFARTTPGLPPLAYVFNRGKADSQNVSAGQCSL